jgi:hypothetical protein
MLKFFGLSVLPTPTKHSDCVSTSDLNIFNEEALRRPAEVKQFAKLLDDIQVHILGEDINLLFDPFAMLG